MMARTAVAVGLGGMLGALARWGLVEAVPAPTGWPWAIFWANLAGALALGALISRFGTSEAPAVIGASTGFCGGLTTFSSFAVDLALFLRDGRVALAVSYLVVSITLGVGAFAVGRVAARPANLQVP